MGRRWRACPQKCSQRRRNGRAVATAFKGLDDEHLDRAWPALWRGIIYCNAVDVCRRLADYRRASEWTDAAQRWCERQGILAFPSVCRVYQAGILRLRGAWADAVREAVDACEELRPYNVSMTAEA
jgi:hypothetical protein